MSSSSKDYYAIMGLNAQAGGDEIKKRYRELARRYHPDVNPKPEAAQKIKEINEAYSVLGDAERRASYDGDRVFEARMAASSAATPTSAPRAATPSQPPRPAANTNRAGGARPVRPTPPPNRAGSSYNRNPSNVADTDWDSLLYGRRQGDTNSRPRAATGPTRPEPAPTFEQAEAAANRDRAAAQRKANERAGDIKRLVGEAQLAFINRRYAEAEDFSRQVIRLDNRNAMAYELLGNVARKQGNTDAAIQAYTLAVQLNPRNQSVQANLDRLMGVGGKMASHGPTLARTPHVPLAQRVSSDALVNGVGAASLVGLGGCLGAFTMFPGTGLILGLSLNLLFALVVCGALGGVLLALYGGMRPQAQELAGRRDGRSPVPLNSVLALLSLVWFFVSLLAYVVVSITQNRVSASVLRAYGLALLLNVVFILLYHPVEGLSDGGVSVPTAMFAGNLLFPSILFGWKIGDTLRLGRYGRD